MPQQDQQPHVGPEAEIPEATARAVGLGVALAIVLGAANAYLGLYAGMTVSASIPAAVVSMAVLRGVFRSGSILENNIAQTIASAGESLAAGVIFTVPALVLVGVWQDFAFWPTTLIALLGGLLGIAFMAPLRRALIAERPDLAYPEGVACAQVLIAGQEGGSGAYVIASGLLVGLMFKLLTSGLHIIQGAVELAFAQGRRIYYAGADMSVALLAVGYIVDIHIASLVFLGGAIGWLIALPLLSEGLGSGTAVEAARDVWAAQVRYIGVGTMLVGGIHSIWSVRRGIGESVSRLRAAASSAGPTSQPRTDRDMSAPALGAVLLVSILGTLLLYEFLIGHLGAALAATLVMVLVAFLFVAVATYIAGLVGSSNSPVSGMTICALLIAAGVLLALGVRGNDAILATLGVAGVVCCATCTAGDIAQDLKTGQLVGATPARQQWMEIVGVAASAVVFAPVLSLLHHSYGIGTGEEGALRAPQATLFASLAQGFFGDGDLNWGLVGVGVAIGVGLVAVNTLLAASGAKFRTHVMPVAVGIYLPFALSTTILIGGLIRRFSRHRGEAERGHSSGVLLGSGLIAGEALMGIGLAIPVAMGVELPTWSGPPWLALLVFAAVVVGYALLARRGDQTDAR